MKDVPAGWYRLSAKGFAADHPGDSLPHLRIDTSDGCTRYRALAPARRDGVEGTILLFATAVRSVWLVEGVEHSPVRDLTSELEPISRREAIAAMLAGVAARHRGMRGVPALLGSVVGILHGGVSLGRQGMVAAFLRVYRDACLPVPETEMKLRSRGCMWAINTVLVPSKSLEIGIDEGGDAVWRVTGPDPQFVLESGYSPVSPGSGWYRVRLCILAHTGHVDRPELFPDYGHGFLQHAAIRLPEPDRQGWIETLVVFPSRLRGLRFDPSMRPCTFSISDASLVGISRMRALLYLLQRRDDEGRMDWRASMTAGWGFLRLALRKGVSAAATRYLDEMTKAGDPQDYALWVKRYDEIHEVELAEFRRREASLSRRPKISVLLPVYQTPERWLRRCIDSVLAQVYGDWELCIADDASPSPHVRKVLDEYARLDERIRVVHRECNGHISAASNTALAMASGEYVALLDHDDELRPHALLEVAEALQRHPDARFFYSDEDKLDDEGRRFHPNFKPDWNPDLLLSQNYICHLSMIETALARETGGFREGFEGSQDHDLFLRCSARLRDEQIVHIPKVLYHWRAIEGSTAMQREAKDYAAVAGHRAVEEHVHRLDATAQVEMLPHGHYRVTWPLPAVPPKVSLIVPTRDKVELLRTCVETILSTTDYPEVELVIVDNQSVEAEAVDYLRSLCSRSGVKVLRFDAPFNYSAINNMAVAACDGDIVGLVNNDIEVTQPGWLREMVSHAMRPGIGAVGAMLYYPDRTIQHAGVLLGIGGVANHAYMGSPRGYPGHGARAFVAQNFSAVTAACLLIRRSIYEEVGGLDERLAVAFNDVDFCLRVREAGYRNLWTPFAELVHHESATRGRDESPERYARFVSEVAFMEGRWGDLLQRDPAYNPNLALSGWGEDLAFPPRWH